MTTRKYKALVEQRTRETLDKWSGQQYVGEREIYRFLHNLKGTAGTVGLDRVERFASSTLLYFSDHSDKVWMEAEWREVLHPVLDLFSGEETSGSVPDPVLEISLSTGSKQQKYEILLVDDDVELVAFLRESLEQQSYYVNIAMSAERGLKLFYESRPDMILLDILLPDQSGIDVLHQIIGKAKKERIPIIIMSGEHSKDLQLYAYSLGVMDYMPKPVDIDLFLVLIKNRFELKKEWQKSIIIDELTGAYNRRYFNQTMKQLVSDFRRTERIFSLALLDLDYFKQINDTYGHLVGDEVLQAFSELVRSSIRVEDTFCRYGGEEFALFMPNTDAASALLVIERIQSQFAAMDFWAKQQQFRVTFSGGITEIRARRDDPEELIEDADQALYASKHAGRNQTTLYNEYLPAGKVEQVLKVIVVDDDALIRRIVVQQFREWEPANNLKMEVSSFENGAQFLQSEWYSPEDKFIILLDGIMPELDGLEVLKQLRSRYPEVNILVIMLTGRNNQQDIIHALQLGADDYIVKPFHLPEMLTRVERLAHRFLF
ncbi:Protein-glutamate methylesterase/protein-glutamine glutaminase [Paenibacillus auburnensis]|uniref:Protein-glutamate methylesterase/protein-glutamine glutaminase n=1 Tax=Paenibacillus auburnensis TaxID=2905649 RepID=A0ABM9BT35_9BACL|nr:diguanylate cyclase [Paenibacillus auburnensis]CAH1194205.1 Protein-glutamate methylesterase/protein-glutamine glutaminase [Paenibacillus auburnensis]